MSRPLDAVRVLDLTRLVPGAVCSQLLSEMGASVIKVEAPGAGDYMRGIGSPVPSGAYGSRFAALNRDKRSISIDLKLPAGADLLRRLAGSSDVLIENFRPDVMASLGLSYDQLRDRCPELIYCSISAFGQNVAGPPAHDINLLARSGFLGAGGEPPVIPPAALADFETGERAALAVCAALYGRLTGRRGTYIDVAMFDGMVSWMMLAVADRLAAASEPGSGDRSRSVEEGIPGYGLYRTLDGRWLALGAVEDKFWARLCDALQRPDLGVRADASPELDMELAEVIATRSLSDWVGTFERAGVPATAVSTLAEVLIDPIVRDRGLVRSVPDPDGGSYDVLGWHTGLPTDDRATAAAPAVGGDAAAILAQIGIGQAELAALRQAGVVA